MTSAIDLILEPELDIDPLTATTSSVAGYKSAEIAVFRLKKDQVEGIILKATGLHQSKNVTAHLVDVVFEDSIDKPGSVTVTLHDPSWDILNSGALEDPVDINPGGIPHRWYRLDTYSVNNDDITIVFSTRNAVYLSTHQRPYKSNRKNVTRAQFILSLLNHVKVTKIRMYSPQLNKKQPVAKHTAAERRQLRNRTPGFTASDQITVKGGAATQRQKDVIEKVIQRGVDDKMPGLVIVTGVMTVIQETNAGTNMSPGGTGGNTATNVFEQDASWQPNGDPYHDAHNFFKECLRIFNLANGNIDLGVLAARTQRPLDARAYSLSADRWRAESQHAVNSFGGINVNDPGASSTSIVRETKYEFDIGGPNHEGENYLGAIYRLADDVNWAAFWVKDVLYYQSYQELFAAKAVVRVRRYEGGVEGVNFSYDRMKRTDQMTLQVRMDEWAIPVGSVVVFDEGDATIKGRWIVTNVRRSIFDQLGEIELSKPKSKKLEPPIPVETISVRNPQPGGTALSQLDTGADIDTLKGILDGISSENHPYLYGGGHQKRFEAYSQFSHPEPLDCSAAVSWGLWLADMYPFGDMAIDSTHFWHNWGKPGRGQTFTVWANPQHVFLEGEGLYQHWRFDTGVFLDDTNVRSGPQVRNKWREDKTGFHPRHWKGH